MSEIPYYFETPVPKYFRETGWFESEHMFKFITWSFAKCQNVPHKEIYYGREILLAPFEFIAGRLSSPKECFLSENIFRNQINQLLSAGLLVKSTNSLTNKYTCYIWVTDRFSKNNNQQNNQQITNRPPTDNHKSRRKKNISKENHPSIPSVGDEGMSDDFSSNLEKEEVKTEIYQGIFLTQSELDACVKIKGDIEKVKQAIEFIQTSKRRKHDISDWPNALAKWKIENKAKARIEDHLAYAEKLCKIFPDFKDGNGWRCYMYTDKKKDQRGILFESQSAYQEALFVSLVEGEFMQKCSNFVRDKKMEKK